jgi:hypothetical protein
MAGCLLNNELERMWKETVVVLIFLKGLRSTSIAGNRQILNMNQGCHPLDREIRSPVFENGVLRRIFGPKKDEETGGRRKLHSV